MKTHGLMFKADLVRAMLNVQVNSWPPMAHLKAMIKDGIGAPIKWQTRRPIDLQPTSDAHEWNWGCHRASLADDSRMRERMVELSRFKVGDEIAVRETFARVGRDGQVKPWGRIAYRASEPDLDVKWTPAVHMPLKSARLVFKIQRVRVQRVEEISGEDALAEGIDLRSELYPTVNTGSKAKSKFLVLWTDTYWKRAKKEKRLPGELWVYALDLRRLK